MSGKLLFILLEQKNNCESYLPVNTSCSSNEECSSLVRNAQWSNSVTTISEATKHSLIDLTFFPQHEVPGWHCYSGQGFVARRLKDCTTEHTTTNLLKDTILIIF